MTPSTRKHLTRWLGLGLAAVLLFLAVRRLQWPTPEQLGLVAAPRLLLPALALFSLGFWGRVWRLRWLAGSGASLPTVWKAHGLAFLSQLALPFKAGLVLRPAVIHRYLGIGLRRSIGVVFAERLGDVWFLAALSIPFASTLLGASPQVAAAALVGAVLAGLLVIPLIRSWQPQLIAPTFRLVTIPGMGHSLLAIVGPLAGGIWLATETGLGLAELGWWALAVHWAAAIVPTPAGIGAYEAVSAEFLLRHGVDPGLAAAVTVLSHALGVGTQIAWSGAAHVRRRRSDVPEGSTD